MAQGLSTDRMGLGPRPRPLAREKERHGGPMMTTPKVPLTPARGSDTLDGPRGIGLPETNTGEGFEGR